ncbi:hypothetical protein KDL29_14625 [bacterium]|nr:hypothetical protein [bacterium]
MDRGDYSAKVSYSGPPVRPPRPWFLHPAFFVLVLLVLGGSGWALKDRLKAIQLRSKGVNAKYVDGQLVVELPAAGTLIGEQWAWRELDNPEQHGLESGQELWQREQDFTKEVLAKGENPEDYPWLKDKTEDMYDFMYWGYKPQADVDGDGVMEIVELDGKQLSYLDAEDGWHSVGSRPVKAPFQNDDVLGTAVSWDYNRDGTPDLVVKYYEEYSSRRDWENEDLVVIDGRSGKRVVTWHANFLSDSMVADFDGDGEDELAYVESTDEQGRFVYMVRGKDGAEVGSMFMQKSYGVPLVLDSDGDGRSELLMSTHEVIELAAIGMPTRNVLQGMEANTLVGVLTDPQGGIPRVLLASTPLTDSMAGIFGGYSDFDFENVDEAEFTKQMKEMEKASQEFDKLIRPTSNQPTESPAYALDEFRHFQSLSAEERSRLTCEMRLADLASGQLSKVPLPEQYLRNSNSMFSEYAIQLVRLPQYGGDLVCVPPERCGSLLVTSYDGKYVHYEEFGEIPLHCEVLKGDLHDYIVVIFEDRILVYP